MKVEGGENKGKGVKREREEENDKIQIPSGDEDLESLQVPRTTPHTPSRLLTISDAGCAHANPGLDKEKGKEIREARD